MNNSNKFFEFESDRDNLFYALKLKYIINFLIYIKSTKKQEVDTDLYQYIFEEIYESDSIKILKKLLSKKNIDKSDFNSSLLSDAVSVLGETRKANIPILDMMIKALSSIIPDNKFIKNKSVFLDRIQEIKKIFTLSGLETEIITSIYLIYVDDNFSDFFCSYLNKTKKTIGLISVFTDKRYSKILKLLCKKSALRRYGIIEFDNDLSSEVVDFLDGANDELLSSKYYSKYSSNAMSVDSFNKYEKHIKTLNSIISGKRDNEGINILLYGEPGTGKTEFSRSLGKFLNKNIYELNHFDEDGEPMDDERKFTGFNIYRKSVPSNRSILIIDEADEMLNGSGNFSFFVTTRNKEKSIVNKIMDDSKHICIWISNEHQFIEESTRRRFDYSIKFCRLSKIERRAIWANSLEKYNLTKQLSVDEINYLVEEYEISAGGIDIALKNCTKIVDVEEVGMLEAIEKVLEPHKDLMLVPTRQITSSKNYSINGLNIKNNFKLDRIINICQNFYNTPKNSSINNMNILLHGVPGSGKTEFAKYLAEVLEHKIYIKTGSDLLDMYVGGTEKNIRDAFVNAESENAILFIDEVDGVFADRRNASKRWEVTQVNELLSRMENFKGIFIASTNFKDNIDSAANRRFNLKIEFDYLDNSGKKIFFDRLLGDLTDNHLTESEINYLNQIEFLTPGDYKVVWQKHCFIDRQSINNMSLLKSLKEEVNSKNGTNKQIGF